MTEFEQNEQIAHYICQHGNWQGRSFAQGEYVGLLDGEIVTVGADLDQVVTEVRKHDPAPDRGMVFQVAPPTIDVIR